MSKIKYKRFIIGKDSKGKVIEFTCDEKKLSNYFGLNPNAPHFLTHVYFKKEVLDKYYNKPSEYSINDGSLFYGTLWMMPIDNNQKENIMVYLGDLGKLPYEEQEHWKLFNILISDGKISETSYKRDFMAEFCSPIEPVLYFKERFEIFNKKWKERFGWDLFKSLNKEDEHHWKTLKIPAEEQKEFDEKILSLTKILIDSLNSEEIKKGVIIIEGNTGSISQIESFLKQKCSLNSPQMFEFLRKLQTLRSKAIHFKNDEYKNIYSYFDKGTFSKTFEGIIIGAITLLNTLESNILKEMKK